MSQSGNFQAEYFVNIRGSQSPRGKWTIIPPTKSKRGGLNQIAWMVNNYSMKWTDLRRLIARAFVDISRDPSILFMIKGLIMKFVAVRSGRLLDFILTSMRLNRRSWYNTQFWARFNFDWPVDRPLVIKNPSHIPPSEGYGEWGTVKLNHNIPNVSVKYVTLGGNALYNLNDPTALPDPRNAISKIAEEILLQDFEDNFDQMTLIYKIP